MRGSQAHLMPTTRSKWGFFTILGVEPNADQSPNGASSARSSTSRSWDAGSGLRLVAIYRMRTTTFCIVHYARKILVNEITRQVGGNNKELKFRCILRLATQRLLRTDT